MKKILIFSITALSILSLSSCEKELDKFPEDTIELSNSLKTLNDAKAWNLGNLARMRSLQYGTYMFYADVQSDMLNATVDFGNRNGNPHRWGQSFLADDQTLRPIWANYYNVIANANLAIAGMPNVPTSTPAQKTELDSYLGAAHLVRAYCYSELVKRYAKPFEPASANTDLGVPIVLTYNVNNKPARSTVKAVYDQIINDINTAKTLLAPVNGALGSKNFTIHSAIALEARVRLHMHDWAGAQSAAEILINSPLYPLANSSAALTAIWQNDAPAESIQVAAVSAPNELPLVNAIYLGLIPATGRFAPDFVPSKWVVDSFENTDLRKSVYFEQKNLTLGGANYSNIWLVNKYQGNPTLFTSAVTNYAHTPKIFRIGEMYLISAEAGSRGANAVTGLNRLTQLRTARGLTTPASLSGAAFVDFVRNERFREMAFEGERLWDLKRWHLPCQRKNPQSTAFIITNPASSYHQLNIPADDNQFTWGIPSWDIVANPSLANQQNPGW